MKENNSMIKKKKITKLVPHAKIYDIFKMENPQIIKVRFRIMAMTDRIKQIGLCLFWLSIPPRNIEYEQYTYVPCKTKYQKICSVSLLHSHIF